MLVVRFFGEDMTRAAAAAYERFASSERHNRTRSKNARSGARLATRSGRRAVPRGPCAAWDRRRIETTKEVLIDTLERWAAVARGDVAASRR